MRPDIRRLFVWMSVFFIAMAYLESAVVVYLRALYYPEGFDFPLATMSPALVTTEVWREVATMIMLLVPGALVARSALERFAWFCFGFGVWDIFYYVWLKVLLDWPSSFGSRDLLFLIPVPWVGPVWAPCVVSLGLIGLALVLLYGRSKQVAGLVDGWSWGSFAGRSIAHHRILHLGTGDAVLRRCGFGRSDGHGRKPLCRLGPWSGLETCVLSVDVVRGGLLGGPRGAVPLLPPDERSAVGSRSAPVVVDNV